MRVYISGPITNYPDLNRSNFDRIASKVRNLGHIAVNPHEVGKDLPINSDWSDYMRADIKAMMDCDAIVLLTGWNFSRGAHIEKELAENLGMEKIYEHEIEGKL